MHRQRADAALKDRLRGDFPAANPSASPADFGTLYPRLREEHLVREAREAPEREKAGLRARHPHDYRM
jgi:hypothetical protein